MSIVGQIKPLVVKGLKELYDLTIDENELTVNLTKPEFEGDYTVVLFSFIKSIKKSPEQAGKELGEHLTGQHALFSSYNVIKGFLNLTIADQYWLNFLQTNFLATKFGEHPSTGLKVIVEYSSPNTNKPLHLGHLRNIFLGWSVAEILKATGNEVVKTCVVNDRGIHICKSMIAWQEFANGATPESTHTKGDRFVGNYYVKFSNELKRQTQPILTAIEKGDLAVFDHDEKNKINISKELISRLKTETSEVVKKLDRQAIANLGAGVEVLCESARDGNIRWREIVKVFDDKNYHNQDAKEKEERQKMLQKLIKPVVLLEEKIEQHEEVLKDLAESKTKIMKATQQMLFDWEAGKPDVIELWKKMNQWVYEGFEVTYKRIGADFDKMYYESDTYLLGKKFVEEGLHEEIFYKKEDGSVWIDLTAEGLDEKLVLRKDGTAVYITQDLGLADEKYTDFGYDQSLYVIADEQNYHMKVLRLILEKLKKPYAKGIQHMSYGMVDLPTGRMKSREGTVVDADDILDEMIIESEKKTKEQDKTEGFSSDELKDLYEMIGTGGLKFFLLRVDPKKRMVFNPEESVDLHGFTATHIQYTHARIKSILRKEKADPTFMIDNAGLLEDEKDLVMLIEQYPSILEQAAMEHNPSVLAIYTYELAKDYNSFYNKLSVINAESNEKKQLRLQLSEMTANVICSAMHLLGIRVPERM